MLASLLPTPTVPLLEVALWVTRARRQDTGYDVVHSEIHALKREVVRLSDAITPKSPKASHASRGENWLRDAFERQFSRTASHRNWIGWNRCVCLRG